MALTDIQIRNAKPKEKPFKLGDTGGFGHSLTRVLDGHIIL